MKIPRPWLTAAAISGVITLVAKELALELVFGSAADWLKSNLWILGDFLAWRWSGLTLGLIVVAGVWALCAVAGQERPQPTTADQTPAPKPQAKTAKYIEITDGDNFIRSDGVLWEWDTYFQKGQGGLAGPLCPRDAVELKYQEPTRRTPLAPFLSGEKLLGGQRDTPEEHPVFSPPASEPFSFGPFGSRHEKRGRQATDQDRVGGVNGGRLFCIKCQNDYGLAGHFTEIGTDKTIADARNDAKLLFRAKVRNRKGK